MGRFGSCFMAATAILLALISSALPSSALAAGRVVHETLTSVAVSHNLIGLSPERSVTVYLPDGYDEGSGRYPVVYYLHSLFETDRTPFADQGAADLFDRAMAEGVIGDVIVVSADFSTPLGSSLFVNSPVTGGWEGFLVQELVPHVDATYRTLARSESRGLSGAQMGGYGAIRIGMRHPDVFGAVYALHPVGAGAGVTVMASRPNLDLLETAASLDAVVQGDVFSRIFTAIYQAHLPNPARPPLFIDLPARRIDGRLVIDPVQTNRLMDSFFLERQVATYADNLRRLRGLKFDWGRGDPNPDHVVSNEALSNMLNEYGVPHEAEAYSGGWGDRHWGVAGRIYTDMLPFFEKHLVREQAGRRRRASRR